MSYGYRLRRLGGGRWSIICLDCRALPARTLPEGYTRQSVEKFARKHANPTGHTVVLSYRREFVVRPIKETIAAGLTVR